MLIPYDDIEASKMLLINFFYKFCLDNNDFFDFLYSKGTKELDDLNSQKTKDSFLTATTTSEVDKTKSKTFIDEAIDNFLQVMRTVIIDLFDNYTQTLWTEEAVIKNVALRQS